MSTLALRSPAVDVAVESVAHEVYRQISNRHSLSQPFTTPDLIKLLQAYGELKTRSGESYGCLPFFQLIIWEAQSQSSLKHAHAINKHDTSCCCYGMPGDALMFAAVVSRMLDAIAGHVVKRTRARDPRAPSKPMDVAAILQAYADLGHTTVVGVQKS